MSASPLSLQVVTALLACRERSSSVLSFSLHPRWMKEDIVLVCPCGRVLLAGRILVRPQATTGVQKSQVKEGRRVPYWCAVSPVLAATKCRSISAF